MKQLCSCLFFLLTSISSFSQWNPNTAVNLEVAGLNAADLQTAKTSDGKTWVAFYSNNAGNYDMRAQLLDVAGNKLLGSNGLLVCSQPSGSATFVFNVCLDASDNLVIAFQYQVAGVNNAVVTKVTPDGNLPWGANGVLLGPGLAPYPAVLSTGETVVAWGNSSPSTLYMQKISSAGAMVWGAPVPVTVGATLTTRGQVVANAGGYFTLVFQRKGVGISTTFFAQRYNDAGIAQWVAPVQISTLTTSGARYYSVLAEADVTYVGYYASGGTRFYAYVQKINADGTIPWGPNGSVFSTYSTGSDPYQQTTNIAHKPGSPYVWAVSTYTNTAQSQSGIYIQKFDAAAGTKLLDPLGKEVYPISASLETQAGKLALVNDQPVFMSYDINYKIYATLLNAAGDFVWAGNRVEISSTTATLGTPKGRFAFTDVVNGQAVGIWYENRGVEYRPYAQNIIVSAAVPVTLGDFKATNMKDGVRLSWFTTSEQNNQGFFIEKSVDGLYFADFKFVPSSAPGGNSNVQLNYEAKDDKVLQSGQFYRLRQIDLDGRANYSAIILIRVNTTEEFFINRIYPQPAAELLNVSLQSKKDMKATLNLWDINGKKLKEFIVTAKKGSNLFRLDVSSFAKGTYIIKINADGKAVVGKWIKD
jgi:hypothetical protein